MTTTVFASPAWRNNTSTAWRKNTTSTASSSSSSSSSWSSVNITTLGTIFTPPSSPSQNNNHDDNVPPKPKQQQQQQHPSTTTTKQGSNKVINILLTAYVNPPDKVCDGTCRSTRRALSAHTSCAARTMSSSFPPNNNNNNSRRSTTAAMITTNNDSTNRMLWEPLTVTELLPPTPPLPSSQLLATEATTTTTIANSFTATTTTETDDTNTTTRHHHHRRHHNRNRRRLRRLASWNGPGPNPYYIKIHILEQLLFGNSLTSTLNKLKGGKQEQEQEDQNNNNDEVLDWILWVDGDVRIVNMTYPIELLLDSKRRYPTIVPYSTDDDNNPNNKKSQNDDTIIDNDVSIIMTSQYTYGDYINDVFFIKNNVWGKLFLQTWKFFVLGSALTERGDVWYNNNNNMDDEMGQRKTCGSDQCPFGLAILQTIQDYYDDYYHRKNNDHNVATHNNQRQRRLRRRTSYNTTLEGWSNIPADHKGTDNVQLRLVSPELARLLSLPENNGMIGSTITGPIQSGPVLFVPAFHTNLTLLKQQQQQQQRKQPLHDTNGQILLKRSSKDSNESLTDTTVFDIISSSTAIEPTNKFQELHETHPWPFTVHAKYSTIFCNRPKRQTTQFFPYFYSTIQQQHEMYCTAQEFHHMRNTSAECWSRWGVTTPPPPPAA